MSFIAAAPVHSAELALPPFYEKVMQLKPSGPLGKVLAKEPVATSIPGANAWRIAYVSSDINERPTISTGFVIAPKGKMPKGLRFGKNKNRTFENCLRSLTCSALPPTRLGCGVQVMFLEGNKPED